MSNIIHVVGTGTIGEPLIRMLLEKKDVLGISKVTFQKKSALLSDRSKVDQLISSGAELYSDIPDEFAEIGIKCSGSVMEAILEASVVIDCTPNGIALKHKQRLYGDLAATGVGPDLYIAQGSEDGFGSKYAFGITDSARSLLVGSSFAQVVSCNTHSLGSIVKCIGLQNGKRAVSNISSADFTCIRRANDVSQSNSFCPGVQVGFDDGEFGTHHAKDVRALLLYGTNAGFELCDYYSSAMKVPTQYMHSVRFKIELKDAVGRDDIIDTLRDCKTISLTHKRDSNEIFSFGRDHGLFGRIFSHCVINPNTIHVKGNIVSGFAFTPQDGNSLLSSIALATYAINPGGYKDSVMKAFGKYLFLEV